MPFPPSSTSGPRAEPHARPEEGSRAADKARVRDAATVIVLRGDGPEPRVLMGQRGTRAAFMASKFVFPGGAVDAADADVPPARPLGPEVARRLEAAAPPGLAHALAMAAVRELWEETGLALAAAEGPVPEPVPASWEGFFAAGHRPDPAPLRFVFRAITPEGRPRRFDARFFLVDAAAITGDLDDFSRTDAELSGLSWLTLAEARALDLPFITRVVLAEIEDRLKGGEDAARPVPFFHHGGGRSFVDAL